MKKSIFISLVIFYFSSLNFAQNGWSQLYNPIGGCIYSICEISDSLYIGTSNSGIYCPSLEDSIWQRIDFNKILTEVYSLKADSLGRLYAGTAGSIYKIQTIDTSVNRSNKKIWQVESHKPKDRNIYSITLTKNNDLLIGTDNGVYKLASDSSLLIPLNEGLKNLSINILFIDSHNNLYAGTISGVFRSTNNGIVWEDFSTGLKNNNNIRTITESVDGTLYLGTHGGGVFKLDPKGTTWNNISDKPRNGIPNPYISGIACDLNGYIFASTYEYGVYFSKNKGTNWSKLDRDYSDMRIYSLYLSPKTNIIYVGTLGSGVYKYDISQL